MLVHTQQMAQLRYVYFIVCKLYLKILKRNHKQILNLVNDMHAEVFWANEMMSVTYFEMYHQNKMD